MTQGCCGSGSLSATPLPPVPGHSSFCSWALRRAPGLAARSAALVESHRDCPRALRDALLQLHPAAAAELSFLDSWAGFDVPRIVVTPPPSPAPDCSPPRLRAHSPSPPGTQSPPRAQSPPRIESPPPAGSQSSPTATAQPARSDSSSAAASSSRSSSSSAADHPSAPRPAPSSPPHPAPRGSSPPPRPAASTATAETQTDTATETETRSTVPAPPSPAARRPPSPPRRAPIASPPLQDAAECADRLRRLLAAVEQERQRQAQLSAELRARAVEAAREAAAARSSALSWQRILVEARDEACRVVLSLREDVAALRRALGAAAAAAAGAGCPEAGCGAAGYERAEAAARAALSAERLRDPEQGGGHTLGAALHLLLREPSRVAAADSSPVWEAPGESPLARPTGKHTAAALQREPPPPEPPLAEQLPAAPQASAGGTLCARCRGELLAALPTEFVALLRSFVTDPLHVLPCPLPDFIAPAEAVPPAPTAPAA
eukprot:TRINITY_DN4300_c0_g2_i2.p1 TRINITY_DN4300_c0_g2~~TRINITY_DN4300_c0_g2_i2.p1  ORF type:complete len:491 (+),score=97.75 TRINITY_DN4300_c0_g2_i2:458-1930(+)